MSWQRYFLEVNVLDIYQINISINTEIIHLIQRKYWNSCHIWIVWFYFLICVTFFTLQNLKLDKQILYVLNCLVYCAIFLLDGIHLIKTFFSVSALILKILISQKCVHNEMLWPNLKKNTLDVRTDWVLVKIKSLMRAYFLDSRIKIILYLHKLTCHLTFVGHETLSLFCFVLKLIFCL